MKKKFTQEFRNEAVKLVKEHNLSVQQVCDDLGIGRSTLEKWLRDTRELQNGAQALTESEKEELKRLRKENHTLRMERDILKKATAFFSKNSL